ncbi:hypothetical protein ACIA8O_39975 [Kitasatospora sp. NPDC051853]|uniref:hypothetical protein n=1 Tax=Kitasatospora sp. NPDC051853 TaxID=3364058 RepID=UPI0037A19A5B
MSWRDVVQPALRLLLQPGAGLDPQLEVLRLGAEHEDIDASDVVVTPTVSGALVTGTLVSTTTWERLHLRQLGDHDTDLQKVVRQAVGHLDSAADEGRRRREVDRYYLHLRDVTYRGGRSAYTLPTWRGSVTAVTGWTLGAPVGSAR